MQQETLKLNRVQFIRLKKLGRSLKEEFKKRNAIQIEIPPLIQAMLSFKFNSPSPFGRNEELTLFVESKYFNIPETQRGNGMGYPGRDRNCSSMFIPLNRSFKNQKISIAGTSKAFPGSDCWNDSDMKLLKDHPLEKIIGFNSSAQPDNYEAMICIINFH
jgi:hypothetical protein